MPQCNVCNCFHTVVVPTVHSNGTSGKELAAQLEHAQDALKDAIQALQQASPNGRDYYVSRNGDQTQTAIKAHCLRIEKITEVALEIHQMWEHVQESINLHEEATKR